jgi:hypothetical protein
MQKACLKLVQTVQSSSTLSPIESNAWTDAEFEHYLQMQRKRERLASEVRENTEALIRNNTGLSFSLPVSQPRYLEYIRSDLSQRETAHIDNGR